MKSLSKKILLIDLPTFPKGIIGLSLPTVAACLQPHFTVEIIDLNIDILEKTPQYRTLGQFTLCGLKVCSQNVHIAIELTANIRKRSSSIKILWGGELPTLLPDLAGRHADCVVKGQFEPVVRQLVEDLQSDRLKSAYSSNLAARSTDILQPALDLLDIKRYLSYPGIPLETSRGCDKYCSFCMVHHMQKDALCKSADALQEELIRYRHQFVNVIDYNLGMFRNHTLMIADLLKQAEVLGWTAEMCLESLDDDEILTALQKSRCKIIYCGLESLETKALKSIAKSSTNKVENYKRIIRKAQSYDIQISGGFILGLPGTNSQTFRDMLEFFTEMNLIYAKLTFLIFNPGTKVQDTMRHKGRYLTQDIHKYDGHHLTYLPNDVLAEDVYQGAETFIREFYSLSSLWRRSSHLAHDFAKRLEFILFSQCYGRTYRLWLDYQILSPEKSRFQELLRQPLQKGMIYQQEEALLRFLRYHTYRRESLTQPVLHQTKADILTTHQI
jgi:radical SAM superfamily enzyme YgiQ (UPF0313 family)